MGALRSFVLVALCCSAAVIGTIISANDEEGNWPAEVPLGQARRPIGAVAARGTQIFVATVGGELWRIDVKGGSAAMINRGGDGQPLAGLCADERGKGTLYGCGRTSGLLFAFNYDGVLVRKYQITPPSTPAKPHYIASCVHSRYKLMITDAYANSIIWFPVADKGKEAGQPPPINPDPKLSVQGFELKLAGLWPGIEPRPPQVLAKMVNVTGGKPLPRFGGYGIEWSGRWNTTGYIMHSSSGRLFAFDINSKNRDGGALAVPIQIQGQVKSFPGSFGILFDSSNEFIMYICIPRANAIAVIEFEHLNRYKAKFIRYVRSLEMVNPVVVSEYGNFIYPISGHFRLNDTARRELSYSVPRLSRHKQVQDESNFTTLYDSIPAKLPNNPLSVDEIEQSMLVPPKVKNFEAEGPTEQDEDETEQKPTPPPTPSPKDPPPQSIADTLRHDSTKSECFPSQARVRLRDGTLQSMDQLRIGDDVLVAPGTYSKVFSFTHRDPMTWSGFVEITLADGRSIRLTPGHLLYSANGSLFPASHAGIGCQVDASTVVRVRRLRYQGLYNPQTLHGSIVVDGVQASTYTTAVPASVAHALLTPLRSAWMSSRWLISTLS